MSTSLVVELFASSCDDEYMYENVVICFDGGQLLLPVQAGILHYIITCLLSVRVGKYFVLEHCTHLQLLYAVSVQLRMVLSVCVFAVEVPN